MGRTWRRIAAAALAAAALTGSVAPASAQDAPSPTPVQDRYEAPGPHAVRHDVEPDPRGLPGYELFTPADLGPDGTRHPVITWGNGSFARPSQYAPTLRHLASWGFIVIAAGTDQAGTGQEMLAAVQRVTRYEADPSNRLFHHVDLTRIGAAGHSQGAAGAVNTADAADSPISTVVTFSLPNKVFTFPPDTKAFSPEALTVPVLLLSAGNDQLISGTLTNQAYYRSIRGAAGMALLTAADHNTIQHAAPGYPGYLTAWMRYQLADDPEAARAFTGPSPELLRAPGWQDQALKGLVAPTPIADGVGVTPDGPMLPITGGGPTPVLALALLALALLAGATTRRCAGGAPPSRRP
jgi:hypothetical protein